MCLEPQPRLYLRHANQLHPVALAYRHVLQLGHGPKGRQQVLQVKVQPAIHVPGAGLLVQLPDVLHRAEMRAKT